MVWIFCYSRFNKTNYARITKGGSSLKMKNRKNYLKARKNKIFQIRNRKLIKNINDDFKVYINYCSRLSEPSAQTVESKPGSSSTVVDSTKTKNGSFIVDFNDEESMAFTKPRSVTFLGKEIATPSTWKDVFNHA